MNGLFFPHLVINETLYSLILQLGLSVFTSEPHSFSAVWNWIFNLVVWSVLFLLMAGCFQTYCIRKGHGLLVDTRLLLGGASHATTLCCSHFSRCHHLYSPKHSCCHLVSLFLLSFLIPGRHLSVRGTSYSILTDMSVTH